MAGNGERAVQFIQTIRDHKGPDPAMITEDFGWWTSYHHGVMTAPEIRAMIADIDLPPVDFEVLGVAGDGDRVAVEIQGRCELPDGRRYDNNYCFVVVFRGNLVREMREYCDTKLAADTFGIEDIATNTRKSAERVAQ